jgi:hypothetical protein
MGDECPGEPTAELAEGRPLLLIERRQPAGTVRVSLPPPVRTTDPGRRQTRARQSRAPLPLDGQEAFQGRPGEAAVSTRGRERLEAAGVGPPADRRRRYAKEPTRLAEAEPLGIAGSTGSLA